MPNLQREVFAELFAQSSAGLKRYIRRFVHSREVAEEIAQEAFLRTFKHARDDRPPQALLYSIARNLALDHYRHESASSRVRVVELPRSNGADGGSLETWMLTQERSALLREAVAQLPPQCRAAFALKMFRGLDYQEIARQLGISCKTVEGHVSRGIRATYGFMRKRYQLEKVSNARG